MNELQKLADKYKAQIAQKKALRDNEPREFDQICLTQEIVTLQTVVVDLYTSMFNLQKQN